jgi:mono/diheme cytochrome c family protein
MAVRIRRWLGTVGILLLVVVLGAAIYVAVTWDRVYDAPLPQVQLSTDPAVLARGEYLVYGPAHCVECHGSSEDALLKLADGEKTPLSGGLRLPLGPLGVIYSANLTPDPETGIGRYADAQIARMMRWSVKPNGRATLEPLMPFGDLSDDDLVAILSYLRAQKPVRNRVPENEWTLMGKAVRTYSPVFKPRTEIHPPTTAPAQAMTRERGEYLARYVTNCVGCHTPRDQMTFAATGPEFSGGMEMEPMPFPGADPAVWFRTPNITPAKGSGLTKFPDRETFVARFQRGGRQHAGSVMPWEAFARMSAEDLGAIYEYLHTLSPQEGPTGDAPFRKAE